MVNAGNYRDLQWILSHFEHGDFNIHVCILVYLHVSFLIAINVLCWICAASSSANTNRLITRNKICAQVLYKICREHSWKSRVQFFSPTFSPACIQLISAVLPIFETPHLIHYANCYTFFGSKTINHLTRVYGKCFVGTTNNAISEKITNTTVLRFTTLNYAKLSLRLYINWKLAEFVFKIPLKIAEWCHCSVIQALSYSLKKNSLHQ